MHRFQITRISLKSLQLSFESHSKTQFCCHYSAKPKPHEISTTTTISPSRVQRLIASQTDPLLAKEIFDYAAKQPNFRHSYSSYLVLVLKLGRSRFFSLVDDILVRLKSESYPLTPTLFYYVIKIYGEAGAPEKALRMFQTMAQFNCKPLPKHLNCVLQILASRRSHVAAGLDLFKTAPKHGVDPDVESYNIMKRALCLDGDLSVAYKLFNKMFERGLVPDEESYRILMQGLCRRGQVRTAAEFLEDMLNKGLAPDSVSYTTLLNSLCRKKRLREAYKLLCRMKVKGCNPDIVHYNTVVTGFVREGRAEEACKMIGDMESSGCLPDLVSYRTLVTGLCRQGSLDEARRYAVEMMSRGFSPHFSTIHGLVKGFCAVGRVEEACGVVAESLERGEILHSDTWMEIVPSICEEVEVDGIDQVLKEASKLEPERGSQSELCESGSWLEKNPLVRKDGNRHRNRVSWYV